MKITISGCPIRNVLARVGDKWSLLVMLTLREEGVMRFGQLQRSVEDISQKSLTQTLRTLEEDGFVLRTVYPEVPPAGVRALRNSGDSDMVMMCIQYEQHPISSFMDDANILDAPVRW